MKRTGKNRPVILIVLSFVGTILIGSFLLSLPIAVNGEPLRYVDALFTATSGVCVTGLTVVDTGTKFTFFGQIVLLVLIQIGGLGLLTVTTFFFFVLRRSMSMTDRIVMKESIFGLPNKDALKFLGQILLVVAIMEAVGAVLLTVNFAGSSPLPQAVYNGIFHSISAFCNAGFSTFSDSFEGYNANVAVNFIIISLIITGGLGFVVLTEIFESMRTGKLKLSNHSRTVLTTTFWLLVSGTALIYILESNGLFRDMSFGQQVLSSYFQSVTPRTAGFNTVNIGMLAEETLFILIIFMFIGASPGSTGGGIKTSTLATIISHAVSKMKNEEDTVLFSRTIPKSIVNKAVLVALTAGFLVIVGTLLLVIFENHGIAVIAEMPPKGLFLKILFEVVSAFGTVGLSTGITPLLSDFGKIVLCIIMFAGRVGPLTLVIITITFRVRKYRYPEDVIMIG